eukprot:CAMPEP_0198118650 /NCGR_PEP_ID=MMETSP1442-20131203/22612_1 /TAXON_ID= /ORGANISM="Craspedostauros australis, Strain CCMP3328" /LENGTH=131 /DNA_ID=CAMNT_0043776955 /DNA_START=147 /DNA_END=539 /DNA_ORIENTATION=+
MTISSSAGTFNIGDCHVECSGWHTSVLRRLDTWVASGAEQPVSNAGDGCGDDMGGANMEESNSAVLPETKDDALSDGIGRRDSIARLFVGTSCIIAWVPEGNDPPSADSVIDAARGCEPVVSTEGQSCKNL